MEGLANYGSDDDYEDSPQRSHESEVAKKPKHKTPGEKRDRDNYEDVGMDLSENEEESSKSSKSVVSSPSHTPPKSSRQVSLLEEKKITEKQEKTRSRSRSRSRSGNNRRERRKRSKSRSDTKSSSKSRSKSRSPTNRNHSRRKDDKHRDRERDKYRQERDSRGRNSYRHRSRSRERDSAKDSSRRHRDKRENRDYRDSRDSRDTRDNREYAPKDRYSKRFERASNKLAHLEKMGIDVNKSQDKKQDSFYQAQNPSGLNQNVAPSATQTTSEDRLLPPGVTGRLREQMERRKALWQKKPEPDVQDVQQVQQVQANTSGKVWQATTFAHDQEGKQANKFKRLMGIREAPTSANDKSTDSMAKKQEELFSSMEQQYEVARTATHTMRGVGLGFGSYQR